MKGILWAVAAAALLLAGPAPAATPGERCESAKNREAGKYAACRQKAEATYALRGDAAKRSAALAKCDARYGRSWPAIENRPAGPARAPATRRTCRNGSGQPIPCAGTGQDGELRKGVDRFYVDNGDGTITDTRTGLMWEKLSDDGTIHDKDWEYLWTEALVGKIAQLNQASFAGYNDWRLPNVNELLTLVNYGVGAPAISPAFNTACTSGCNVLTCSCTRAFPHWSSTAAAAATQRPATSRRPSTPSTPLAASTSQPCLTASR